LLLINILDYLLQTGFLITGKENRMTSKTKLSAGDINILHARLLADQQITYVLDFPTVLEMDRLQKALELLFTAYPLLSCTVSQEGTSYYWVSDQNAKPEVLEKVTTEDTNDKMEAFISAPCEPKKQIPLKILVLHTPTGDRLVLKIDHVLTDASGLKNLMYLLAEGYSQGKINPPINNNRGLSQVFKRVSPFSLINAATKANMPRPISLMRNCESNRETNFLEHVLLDPSQSGKIRQKAKQNNATINDLILTAIFKTVFDTVEAVGEKPFPVMVPVDLRRYLPKEKQNVIGNLSSAVYPCLEKIAGESGSDLLLRVQKTMNAFKSANPGLGAAFLMSLGAMSGGKKLLESYSIAAAHKSGFINETNFGVIDDKRCQFGEVFPRQVYAVGPIQYAPGMLITTSTYQDNIHFVIQSNDRKNFQPFVQKFLQNFANNL